MVEEENKHLSRLRLMADPEDCWDISENTRAAIEFALREIDQLKQALTHVRHYMQAQGPNGVGIREFSAICGVSPTLISKWTSPPLPGVPDFID